MGGKDGLYIPASDKYGVTINEVDALISSGSIGVGAAATAIVSAAGTISSIDITSGGSGYSGLIDIGISSPVGIEKVVGVGTTATATVTITNGAISAATIVNPGLGYTFTNPPNVIIELPTFQTEKITSIDDVEGFTGIITGISSTTNSGQTALKFFFRATKTASSLLVGYPLLIKDTTVGSGVVSVDTHNSSVVGVGTTFLDNVYKVHAISTNGEDGVITCNVQNGSNVSIAETGFHYPTGIGTSKSLGRLSWGRIYNATRSTSPISIGVTGLTVNSGLNTFPTIQRKNYTAASLRGLRSTGAIRVFGLWLNNHYK